MIYELAAVPQAAIEAFAKSLYAFLLVATKGKAVPTEIINGLRKWGVAAMPFATRFELTVFSDVYKNAVKPKGEFDQDKLKELGVELKSAFDMLHKEHDIDSNTLKLIKTAGYWFRTQSEGAYKVLEKNVSLLKDSDLNSAFLKKVGSQKDVEKELTVVVKKLTGKPGLIIPMEDSEKVKKKNLELFKEYRKLRAKYNAVVKDAVANYIRKSGKTLLPYQQVLKYLKDAGIKNTMQAGFIGKIDDQGRWYTNGGKKIQQVPSPMFPFVIMNPNYSEDKDDYVFTVRKFMAKGGHGGYGYTEDHFKKATMTKFGNVDELKTKIKSMRSKWIPLMKDGIKKPQSIAATELEVVYQFNARIGTPSMKALGVSTLRVKNVFPQTNGNVKLSYIGKDGVKFVHILEKGNIFHVSVINNIKALIEGKKPTDLLWLYKKLNGKYVPITAILVNKLWKQLGGGDTGVHKMRTLRGTLLFKQRMDEKIPMLLKKKNLTEKEAREVFNKIAEEVGKELGHMRTMATGGIKITGATAIKSYIDVAVQISFFEQLKMRLPPFLEKFSGK